jgi:hypothetical protein
VSNFNIFNDGGGKWVYSKMSNTGINTKPNNPCISAISLILNVHFKQYNNPAAQGYVIVVTLFGLIKH